MQLFDLDEKPAYRVPAKTEYPDPHGLIAVSTFSGGGGSSLGLKRAGWTIPWASEFIPAARETYIANASPETHVDSRDIRLVTHEDILNDTGLDIGELDLFEGSPPCSSFSSANRRGGKESRFGSGKIKNYSDGVKQSTDDLFDEWLRVLIGLRPKSFLAENVPSLAHGDLAQAFWKSILRRLSDAGYWTHSDVYYAHHFGAATSRSRLFMFGIRRDLCEHWDRFPRRSPYIYTLRDALSTLPVELPEDELANCTPASHHQAVRMWADCKPGGSPEGYGPSGVTGFSLIRCDWDKPCPTITATSGMTPSSYGVMHPDEPRKFTAVEAAWISGFPPDYVNLGKPGQRFERIGRAVPPPMYEGMGRMLADNLLRLKAGV